MTARPAQSRVGSEAGRTDAPRSARAQRRPHSRRSGSRTHRCSRARSDMICAFSAVWLARFARYALSRDEPSDTHPATEAPSSAATPRLVIARHTRVIGRSVILFTYPKSIRRKQSDRGVRSDVGGDRSPAKNAQTWSASRRVPPSVRARRPAATTTATGTIATTTPRWRPTGCRDRLRFPLRTR